MNRWLIPAAALLAAGSVSAQIVREAPVGVLAGRMAVVTPPDISIEGRPERLSPGARIRDTNNMLLLSGSLSGRIVPVLFRRDGAGMVHEVWLLTADEYAQVMSAGDGSTNLELFNSVISLIFGTRR